MRTLRDVQKQFPNAAEAGLTTEQVIQSRMQFGGNRLTPLPHEPLWKKFLDKFDEPIIKILLAAALLSIHVDLFERPATVPRRSLLGGVLLDALAALVGVSRTPGRKHHRPTLRCQS